MFKKLFIFLTASIFVLPVFSHGLSTQASMMGSSGIVTVPSADTINNHAILIGSWILLDNPTGYMPRVLFSFIPRWELGAGVDIQDGSEASFIFNTKYKIYNTNPLDIALGFNFQMNGGPKGADKHQNNPQLFVSFTWYGWAKTSAMFGKTFGDGTNKDEIDFGIGIEKVLWQGDFGGIGFLFDFSNTTYRRFYAPMKGAGDDKRGIFNGGFRINAFKNRLNLDLVWVDVLDKGRSWALSAAFQFWF